jgi:autotransporter-associated beta strand protein
MRLLRLLLLVATASAATAATFTWSGAAGDGDYANAANWSGGVVPPSDGTATLIFTNAGAGVVRLPDFGLLDLARIEFQNGVGSQYAFVGIALINLQGGLVSTSPESVSRFSSSIAFNLPSHETVAVTGRTEIAGPVLGAGGFTKTGSGTLVLSGVNFYSGGTRVEAGAVTFTASGAIPVAGLISSATNSYVGITFTENIQKNFLDRLDAANFAGSVGFDTLPGASAPTEFKGKVDVSGLTRFAGIGSQTSARLVGEIKVGQDQDYLFSGGAGTLFVEGNLNSKSSGVKVTSTFGTPLLVVLRGNNTFTGGIEILNSALVLDGGKSLAPASPSNYGRLLHLMGPGYVGYTENFSTSPNGFLNRIGTLASADAIVGIDSANIAQPRSVTDRVDLSLNGTRTDPYYLGTSSRVTLTGDITPTVGDSLYLTAIKGGHLTVASNLGSNIPGVVVGQTNAFDPQGGTVELTGQNSYTGGTQVRSGTLTVGSNLALGTGSVDVSARANLNVAPSVIISNPLNFSSGARLSGNGSFASAGGIFLGNGVQLSPGGNGGIGQLSFTTGLTLGGGSIFNFDIGNVGGNGGLAWDTLNISGSGLTLAASNAAPITISLFTVQPNGSNGPLFTFDNTQTYSWEFATATSITGFSAGTFTFETGGFLNNLGGGSFFVTQNGTNLAINFTPVPEPSTYALMALGLGVVVVFELRRRRK